MEQVQLLEQTVTAIVSNPYTLVFALLYLVGYSLKEWTSLDNRLISWVQLILGGVLGLAVFGPSIASVTIGFILAYAVIGSYESIKGSITWFKK